MLPGCFIKDPRLHMSMSSNKPGRPAGFIAFCISDLVSPSFELFTFFSGKRVDCLWKCRVDFPLAGPSHVTVLNGTVP